MKWRDAKQSRACMLASEQFSNFLYIFAPKNGGGKKKEEKKRAPFFAHEHTFLASHLLVACVFINASIFARKSAHSRRNYIDFNVCSRTVLFSSSFLFLFMLLSFIFFVVVGVSISFFWSMVLSQMF